MRPNKQSVIQYILVLLAVLVVPHITLADDPCGESDNALQNFASSIPNLSSDDMRQGKFDVKDAGDEFLIIYLSKGNQVFQSHISKDKDIFGDILPAPEITPINVEGYPALFISYVSGAGGHLQCNYVVYPSLVKNIFRSIPVEANSAKIEYLDSDHEPEIVAFESQE